MTRFLIVTSLLLAIPQGAWAADKAKAAVPEPVLISMVGSNSVDQDLPFGVFDGHSFRALPEARFVKVHVFPDASIAGGLGRIEVEPCPDSGALKNVTAYINFDEKAANSAENDLLFGAEDQEAKAPFPFLVIKLDLEIPVDSVTFNFGDVDHVCVRDIRLFARDGHRIPVRVPKVVEGRVEATSILSPVEAYAPQNLFDSRFEFSWATDKQPTGAALNFHFDKKTHIEKLKLWNGYQRSLVHCQDNSRARTVQISGDGGYKVSVPVADVLKSQVLDLPRPFDGQELSLQVVEAFPGRAYKDLVLSELRFFDGKDWFLLNPLEYIHSLSRRIKEQFAKAGLEAMLNREFRDRASLAAEDVSGNWLFRVRSDGTIYVSGWKSQGEKSEAFSALGNYEIRSADAKGLQLRIFGIWNKSPLSMDCNGCGWACNSTNKKSDVASRIFQQVLTLRPGKDKNGKPVVEVINGDKKGKLEFKKLVLGRSET